MILMISGNLIVPELRNKKLLLDSGKLLCDTAQMLKEIIIKQQST